MTKKKLLLEEKKRREALLESRRRAIEARERIINFDPRKEIKQQQPQQRQVGESLVEKRLGRLPLVSFRIVQGKKIIEPWKGQAANIMEWMRNSSAMLGDTREEIATYWKIEKDSPIYFEDSVVADLKMDVSYFTSEKDGRVYDVATRLVSSSIKPGSRTRLVILGCCSLMDVKPEKE